MKEVILIKNGELALKGLNRCTFESKMVKDIRRRIKRFGEFTVVPCQSTVTVTPQNDEADIRGAFEQIIRVFGIAGACRCAVCEKDMEAIQETAAAYLGDRLNEARTFKAEAKRADKKFPFKSPQICENMGEYILNSFPHLTVDVHHPDVTVRIEVREREAYIHADMEVGAGGMPVGSNGRALLLLSGGIDSPVAGWMMAKRGVSLSAIHFLSPPYTGERARLKVESLCEQVANWSGHIRLYEINFTKIQEALRDNCPEELFTILMRRQMMKISQIVARRARCKALITGESIGQVASQTMDALVATDCAVDMPVFRPLIGMDKEEIIRIARHIDTFETSILPYEDCCTVFTPRHPKTRPVLSEVLEAESRVDFTAMIEEAVEKAVILTYDF